MINREGMSNADQIAQITGKIVRAYVASNRVDQLRIGHLITAIRSLLAQLAESGPDAPPAESLRPAAAAVKHSLTADYLICLEDGIRLKMLKRHLRTHYDLTPQQYREKWGLPADYPMVAPNYAARRSELARQIGLGGTMPARGRKKAN